MPKTILITGARAPVALHLARILTEAGHRIILADSQRFAMSRATCFKHAFHRLPRPVHGIREYGEVIEALVESEGCDLILPTCEEIFFLAAWRDHYGCDLPLIAPPFETLKAVHNKFTFAKMTESYEASAANTTLLTSRDDVVKLAARANDLVFKPVWSRFGNSVLVKPSPEQLAALSPTAEQPWIAQGHLPGEELCTWSFFKDGNIRALASYRPTYRAGKGAAVAFEPVDEPVIREFVERFCSKHSWSGHLAFDFRRDADGALHVLECNPRATSGVHFFGPNSGLAGVILGGREAMPDVCQPMTLPLAMLVYGLPEAIRLDGFAGFSKWRKDAAAMADISAWPGDRSLLPMQLLSLCEITAIAIKNRCGLTTAATSDIEWNGEDLGSGCR